MRETSSRPTILLTDPVSPSVHAAIEKVANVVLGRVADKDTWRRDVEASHAMIVRSFLPDDVFDGAPNMLIAVRHGAGADLIPIDNATANGVAVANVPGVNGNAVAEHVVAQMIALSRLLPQLERTMRQESWAAARAITGRAEEIGGKTVGIVGVGSVGKRLAEICHVGFGMRVLGHQRRLDNLPPHVEGRSLESLFAESDFVVLACPLTKETQGMVGSALLASMKGSAYLINVARGPIVDEQALLDCLRNKKIAGAALDVFEVEPLATDNPLLQLDNLIVSPHSSGISRESAVKLGMGALSEVMRVLAGEKPASFVNPACWEANVAKHARLFTPSATAKFVA